MRQCITVILYVLASAALLAGALGLGETRMLSSTGERLPVTTTQDGSRWVAVGQRLQPAHVGGDTLVVVPSRPDLQAADVTAYARTHAAAPFAAGVLLLAVAMLLPSKPAPSSPARAPRRVPAARASDLVQAG